MTVNNNAKFMIAIVVSAIVGRFIEYVDFNLSKDYYTLKIAENSYFMGCASQSKDLSNCKDLADQWRIRIKNAVWATP
jgi:hypothetical protein